MGESLPDHELLPAGYEETLEAIKAEVRSARIRVARTANSQMIELYWRLGRLIVERQLQEGRRTRVIARLAADLQTEFPDVRGFSAGNLDYMRRFATACSKPLPYRS
jgi:predicted nuclease of restriction endonuclease-like (RecB) superfamily